MSHAELSPSTSHRWLRCTASVPFIRKLRENGDIPEDNGSRFADEGTVAHGWAAQALNAFRSKARFNYEQIPDRLMANHVKAFVDLVTSKVTGDGQLWVEHSMPLFYAERGVGTPVAIRESPGGFWLTPIDPDDYTDFGPYASWDEAKAAATDPDGPLPAQGYWLPDTGTADAVVLTDECLYVFDLKYGVGVSVEGVNNDQTGIYAESFIQEQKLRDRLPAQFDVQPTIFQPRDANHDLPPERVWFTTLGELEQLSQTTASVADLIRTGRVSGFVPGKKQCRFCPAKAKCVSKARHDLDPTLDACAGPMPVTEEDIVAAEKLTPQEIEGRLSPEYLERIAALHLEGHFTDWLDSVVSYVMARRIAGHSAGGPLKLVMGRKNRVWADEEKAKRLLRLKIDKDKVVTEKVISPSQAWELLPKDLSTKYKNKVNALTVKPEGSLTLVLTSDKREAVEVKPPTAQSEFADVIEEDLS